MADLDLDEHRLGKRPRFGGINFRHSWKMTGIEPGREISTKAAFQSLTSVGHDGHPDTERWDDEIQLKGLPGLSLTLSREGRSSEKRQGLKPCIQSYPGFDQCDHS
ncbi:MAG: hypothetical protein P1U90_13640, partial [Akkermansiaceae bacterium]|nr:hypothetical protein [Akkermansiaceae bacterium]